TCITTAYIVNTPPYAAILLYRQNFASLFSQTHHFCGHDIHTTASWNIVEHDRQGCDGGDGLEMAEESFLTWLVVIGRDEQRAIDAEFLGQLCVDHRVVGGI